jgi:ElaB/YqjD/DUF883 family membrane-anchored ribosome-binding protein
MNRTHAHYETPGALRHDAHTLADDARALLDATSKITDEKVAEARERLADALTLARQTYDRVQEKAADGAQAVDRTIRGNPYQSLAIAFGVGALLGFLITRRE